MRRALCLVVVLHVAPACAQILSVARLPPSRAFGVLVGDSVAVTAIVTVGPETRLDAASLPSVGPIAPSVDIRGVEVASDAVAVGTRYAIGMTYQSFAAPDHVGSVDVPAYTLSFMRSGERITARIDGFSFNASPLQNASLTILDASALRPDAPALLMDTAAPRRVLAVGGAIVVMAACGLAASLGALRVSPRRAGPFAAALRQIESQRGDAGKRGTFLLLHRAFDETAQARVFAEDLDEFFARHQHFERIRGDIVAFFKSSERLFFGGEDETPAGLPEDFARSLARVERRS